MQNMKKSILAAAVLAALSLNVAFAANTNSAAPQDKAQAVTSQSSATYYHCGDYDGNNRHGHCWDQDY